MASAPGTDMSRTPASFAGKIFAIDEDVHPRACRAKSTRLMVGLPPPLGRL